MRALMGCVALWPVVALSQTGSLWGEETKVSVGLGLGATPEYVGAEDFRLAVVPHVQVSRGIFFADVRRGVGVQYRNDRGFAARSSIGYDAGRGEKREVLRPGSSDLQGMGKVEASAVWNVTLAQELTPWLGVNGEANIHLGGHKGRGHDYRVGVESKVFDNGRDAIKLNANAHIGDGDYNQTYFGVSEGQSAGSGFPAFQAGGGVYGVSAGAVWERRLDDHWSVGANARVLQLVGDAAESPLTGRASQATVMATVRYDF